MIDTPKYIMDLQLKLWLSKSPGERLYQMLIDNEALFLAFNAAKDQLEKIALKKAI